MVKAKRAKGKKKGASAQPIVDQIEKTRRAITKLQATAKGPRAKSLRAKLVALDRIEESTRRMCRALAI